MESATITNANHGLHNSLIALRKRAQDLIAQTESEEILAEAVGILTGKPLPCAYSFEQMEEALRASEADYQKGDYTDHETMRQRYGL